MNNNKRRETRSHIITCQVCVCTIVFIHGANRTVIDVDIDSAVNAHRLSETL